MDHPVDQPLPAQRRRIALAEIDTAPYGWQHAKICAVVGLGFFTDAYDQFAIGQCAKMIETVYSSGKTEAELVGGLDFGLKVSGPVGTVVGQLFFGWAADRLGRKKMYGLELIIMVGATFGQMLAGNARGANIYGVLITYRFILGIGIGGDYPLSAVITSEFAATRYRGRMMNAVFSLQAVGQLVAALVSLIVVRIFKASIINDPLSVDHVWRIIIGIGMVPAIFALYYRLTIPETARFTMDVERNLEQAEQDADFVRSGKFDRIDDRPIHRVNVPRASRNDFKTRFSQWGHLKVLIGTSYSWFAQDVAFYGLALNSVAILSRIGIPGPLNKTDAINGDSGVLYNTLYYNAVGNIVLATAGLIPGFIVSFLLIDVWGRKPIQFMGFSVLTAIFLCMGFGYDAMSESRAGAAALFFLYCLSNFFQNFGPNSTTFIIPGEVFPTRYRATCHGISAALGKLGAIVSQVAFSRLSKTNDTKGFTTIFAIFALFMFTGVFSTMLLPETVDRSLEELNGEEEDMEDRFARHDGAMENMELDDAGGRCRRRMTGP
ncbi:Inorganic phosphate transporter pho84 [Tulasnella sp. JGI-2019a]|nr:Inorganic phosphate transporter pho84 [Tulasnella sp. JGI-2019a]